MQELFSSVKRQQFKEIIVTIQPSVYTLPPFLVQCDNKPNECGGFKWRGEIIIHQLNKYQLWGLNNKKEADWESKNRQVNRWRWIKTNYKLYFSWEYKFWQM